MSDLAKVLCAVEYAVGAHEGAYRKSAAGEPYVVHPLRVAQRLAENGFTDVALLQAAILHDVIEDTDVPLGEIEAKFGAKVARIVGEVTDDKTLSQLQRKKAQVEHIETMSAAAVAIKLADALDNLTDMTRSSPPVKWSPQKVQGYMVWKATIAGKVAGMHPVLDNLLAPIFAGTFSIDDTVYPAIPDHPSCETQLETYYELLLCEELERATAAEKEPSKQK